MRLAWQLEDAMRKAYGPTSLNDLAAVAGKEGPFQIVVPPSRDKVRIDLSSFEIRGDTATYSPSLAETYPTRLVRRDGRWLVDATYFTTHNPAQLKDIAERTSATYTHLISMITEKDASLDLIKQVFAQRVLMREQS